MDTLKVLFFWCVISQNRERLWDFDYDMTFEINGQRWSVQIYSLIDKIFMYRLYQKGRDTVALFIIINKNWKRASDFTTILLTIFLPNWIGQQYPVVLGTPFYYNWIIIRYFRSKAGKLTKSDSLKKWKSTRTRKVNSVQYE